MVPLSRKQGALHNELTLNTRIVGNSYPIRHFRFARAQSQSHAKSCTLEEGAASTSGESSATFPPVAEKRYAKN